MIRPVCSQLILILLLALQSIIGLYANPNTNNHISSALTQEYSVEQIHIDELYVEGDENGIYTRVNRYTSKLSSAVHAVPSDSAAPLDHQPQQQQQVHQQQQQQQQPHDLSDHNHVQNHDQYVYTSQQQQQHHRLQQQPPIEQQHLHHELLQQVQIEPHQPLYSHQGEQLYQPQQQIHHNHGQQQPPQPDTLHHHHQQQQQHHHAQNAHNQHLHHHHREQHQIYLQQQQSLSSQQIHQHTQIEWRRESTHDGGEYREIFMHNLETTYPISRNPDYRHVGSCNTMDHDSAILMMHQPRSDFDTSTCNVPPSSAGPEPLPPRNSNVESYPLAPPHYHYESSLMTAIRHYWREISGLCLASAIFLNWLFVVVKRRFVASGFTRHIDVHAEQVVESIQRHSSSESSSPPTTASLTSKDTNTTFNNSSAHDSAFEENASPVSLDDVSSSQGSSDSSSSGSGSGASLGSRPRSSISSTPCYANTSLPSSSLNSSSYTSDYMSRYSSDFDSIRRLGRGGFGIVFEAKNKIDDCNYAVKRICLPLEKEARERVMREVRALAKLDHAGIVRYYNAWLETPPDEWLKQHDAQLGIVHTRDGGLSFPSTDGIYERNGGTESILTRRNRAIAGDHNGDKFGESGDTSNDFFGTKSLFRAHHQNGYSNYMRENSSSPSLDIVFEGSGSIRLEAENSTEESDSPVEAQELRVEKVYLYIQMQLCRKDTLKDWLRTNCENRDNTTIFDFFYQIVDAVEYVHSQDLIHRDLKPSNIFFSLDGTLKIGDFGLCRAKTNACVGSSLDLKDYVADSSDALHTEQVGTQLYMSPEQLNGLSYNHKVDIFAMGLILLELLVPFKTQMQRVNVLLKARNNMFSREFKSEHPDEHELVKSLLDRRPYKRPTATAIKQHELLSNAQLSQPVIERIYHRRRTISNNSSTE